MFQKIKAKHTGLLLFLVIQAFASWAQPCVPPVDVNAGNDTTICTRLKFVNLRGTVQVATGGIWLGGTGTFSPSSNSLNAIYTPSAAETSVGSVMLRLASTGNGLCTADTDTVVIQIKPTPVATFTGKDTACINQYRDTSTNSGKIAYITTNTAGDTNIWSISPAANAFRFADNGTDTLMRMAPKVPGTYTITLIKRNKITGCDSTITKTLRVFTAPFVTITGNDTACINTSQVYSANRLPKKYYFWFTSGGSILGNYNDTTIQVNWTVAGLDTLALYVGDSITGCDSVMYYKVRVFSKPSVNTNGLLTVCSNKRSIYSVASSPGSTYSWVCIGGSIETSTTDTVVRVLWGGPTSALMFVDVVSSVGCQNTNVLSITVNETPTPTLTGSTTACDKKIYTYRINKQANTSYGWVVKGGTILSSSSDTLITVRWTSAGSDTIRVTASNSNGCDSIRNFIITVRPIPIPVITGSTTTCAHKTFTYRVNSTSGNSHLWTPVGGTVLGTATDSIVNIRWGTSGTGSLTVKVTNSFGCDSTVSRSIIIRPTPVPVITGPARFCALKEATYRVTGVSLNSYQWSVIGGTITSSTLDSVVKVIWNANASSGAITIKQTNQFACDSSVTKNVIIDGFTLPVINGLDSACELKQSTYSATTHAGSTYLWTVSGGQLNGSATDSVVTVQWGAIGSGTGSLTLKETNANGCDTSVIKNVRLNPTPAPSFTGALSVCEFKRSSYSISKLPENTYKWIVTGGVLETDDTAGTISVLWGTSGTGSVSLQQSNNYGCDSSITASITIRKTPVPVISGKSSVCSNRSYAYNVPSNTGSTYQWTVTGGVITGSSTFATVSVLWQSPGSGSLSLKETNSLGCDSTAKLTIIVDSTPDPTISGLISACEFKNTVYQADAKITGHQYNWTITGGSIVDSSLKHTVVVKWGPLGSGTVQLRQIAGNTCDSAVSIAININLTPKPVINGNQNVCALKKQVYSVNAAIAGNSYLWTATGGAVQGLFNTPSVTILWGAAGPGKVKLVQKNGFGCDSTVQIDVVIQPTPLPKIISSSPYSCEYKSQSFSAEVHGTNSYVWSVVGGSFIGTNTGPNVNVLWGGQGIGRITLREINTEGCDSSQVLSIQKQAKPRPKIDGAKRACAYSQGNIYSLDVTSAPNYSYQWTVYPLGFVVSGANTNSADIKFDKPGYDTVKVVVTDNLTGCDSFATVVVFIDTVESAQDAVDTLFGCKPFLAKFTADTTKLNNLYKWNFGDGASLTAAKAKHVYTKPGVFVVRLISENASGCKDTAYGRVTVFDLPKPSFVHDFEGDTIYVIDDTIHFTNTSISAHRYDWDMGDGKNTYKDSLIPPPFVYKLPWIYPVKLVATDTITKCVDSITRYLSLRVHENLFVPTSFSPNDDGFNDLYFLSSESIVDFKMLIYTRWGELIFESKDPNFIWDGKYKDKPLPADVYVYVIEGKGYHTTRFPLKGTITLMR